MKQKITVLLVVLCTAALLSFKSVYKINRCYLSFTKSSYLTVSPPDTLPSTAEKFRILNTANGEIKTTRVEGYRVVYKNEKNAPFANLKIELSADGAYESDQKGILESLRYSSEKDTVKEFKLNGFKVYGFKGNSIDEGMIFGNYVMFPGNGVTVYFYFYNTKPQYRHFNTVEEYAKLMTLFLNEYTSYVAQCK